MLALPLALRATSGGALLAAERARYDVYLPAALKSSQAYQYSCEFDAAWVVLQSYGINVGVEQIIARTPFDHTVAPSFTQTDDGFVINGGDIRRAFSGDYQSSFLARSTGGAIAATFASLGLHSRPVSDQDGIENALRAGELVWIKTTVDFKPGRPATWAMPDGTTRRTVLGNDHAVVVIGFNSSVVVIRDVLGPTSSNLERPYEYEVPWPVFLECWAAQENDGLAVTRPDNTRRGCGAPGVEVRPGTPACPV